MQKGREVNKGDGNQKACKIQQGEGGEGEEE